MEKLAEGVSLPGVTTPVADRTDAIASPEATRWASAESYRQIFETNPLPIWVYDSATLQFLTVNEAAVLHYGYSREEFLARTILEIRPEEDIEQFLQYKEAGDLWSKPDLHRASICRHRKRDGTIIHVEITSSLIEFEGKSASLVMANDITRRVHAEKKLQETEECFHHLTDNLHDVLWISAPTARHMTFISTAYDEIWGRRREDLLAQPNLWAEALHPEDRSRVEQAFIDKSCLGAYDETFRIIRPDGGIRWIRDRAFPIKAPSGESCCRLVGIAEDITSRRQAEYTLQENDTRLHLLLSQMPIVLWTTDAELCMTSSMGAGLKALGVSKENNIGRTLYDYFGTTDPEFIHIKNHRRALAGESVAVEVEFNGRMLRSSIEPLRCGDEIIGCLGVCLDITDRRQAEDQLQEYAHRLQLLSRRLLEVQEQERRHLARELHDEIGQALTGLNLTLEKAGQQTGENLKLGLVRAREGVKILTSKIRDLSLNLRPTMLDDLGLVPALLWLFDRYYQQTTVRVAFERGKLTDRFAAEVETAAYRIVQEALTNVARHAGVGEVTVRLWCETEHLCVQIEDYGAGFDATHSRRNANSGGLSGMEERARLLEGAFFVDAALGQGTRITARLPLIRLGAKSACL